MEIFELSLVQVGIAAFIALVICGKLKSKPVLALPIFLVCWLSAAFALVGNIKIALIILFTGVPIISIVGYIVMLYMARKVQAPRSKGLSSINPIPTQRILEAIENGEVLKIKYLGGKTPGEVRSIAPIHIEGEKLTARCFRDRRTKTFFLQKIEAAD